MDFRAYQKFRCAISCASPPGRLDDAASFAALMASLTGWPREHSIESDFGPAMLR